MTGSAGQLPATGDLAAALDRNGWVVLPKDDRVLHWVGAASVTAQEVLRDPARQAQWLRHGGTWFAGVDALPNAPDGSIGGVPLAGPWEALTGRPSAWHRGQLSVIYPGYPGRDPGETEAAHRFRLTRDAAHLDGLLAEGPDKRRFLREPHAFILGIPLGQMTEAAGPLVVWDGSHHLIKAAFRAALGGVAPDDLSHHDLTDTYQAVRREVFDRLVRRTVVAQPGETILLHRMTIHGSAPWPGEAAPGSSGRMIVWFRPVLDSVAEWLSLG
jgi:hypothetical protein